MSEDLETWLEGRPAVVKKMARKYPPGTGFYLHDKLMWVIGYREDGGLHVTEIDPSSDHEKAVATKITVCPCCVDKLHLLVATYEILDDGKAIRCLRCGCISYNSNDVQQRYCGKCKVSHDDIWPPARLDWLRRKC